MFMQSSSIVLALIATPAAAGTQPPSTVDNMWAAIVVLAMLIGLLAVTLIVSPALRRRDQEARRNPEDADSHLFSDGDDDRPRRG